jgi:transaldolase
MKFFLDTAIISEVEEMLGTGLVDGVTTNPSLIAKSGNNMSDTIAKICELVEGPVSTEVTATNWQGMVAEGEHLRKIADNVCVKVPLTLEGLRATYHLTQAGHPVNVTLCFRPIRHYWPPKLERHSSRHLSADLMILVLMEWI